jgi:shikimate kinase
MLIYFVGYLAAGKAKWGKRLAEELGYNFVDTREMMMQASGLDFFTLLQNKELFIKLEQEALEQVSKMKDTVVATSELLPCRGNNMEILNRSGITFYLRAGLGCIMMRIGKDTNKYPMLRGIDPDFIPDFIRMELENRKPFYEKAKIEYLARELKMKKLLELIENQNS